MSEYPPPLQNEQIFNPENWIAPESGDFINKAYADSHYLKWPISQAPSETISGNLIVNNQAIIKSREPYPQSLYVSKSGNDTTGTGAQFNPFLTIQKAITTGEALYSQFTIYIDQGSYVENLTITKGVYLTAMPDFDNQQFDYFQILPAVSLTGNITLSNTLTNYYVVFQNMNITCPNGSKILYNGTNLGRVCFQNCQISSNQLDNIPLIQSLTGGYWHFTSSRIFKQVTNSSATLDFSNADSQFYAYDTEITGNSHIALLAVRNGVSLRNCSLNFGVNTSGTPIILHSGTSTVVSNFTNSGFSIGTNPGPVYKSIRTNGGGLIFANNRVSVSAIFVPGVNYLFESTTTNLNLYIGQNSYYSLANFTLLDKPYQISPTLITVFYTKQIGDFDMGNANISNVNAITSQGDLFLNPVGSVDMNGKTLNMKNGEIHNLELMHSPNNVDLVIEGKGNNGGNIILKTDNNNRINLESSGNLTIFGNAGNITFNSTTSTLTLPNVIIDTIDSANINATYYPVLSSVSNGSGTALYTDSQIQINPSRNSIISQNLGLGVLNDNKFGIVQCNDNFASGTAPAANLTIDSTSLSFGSFSPRFMEVPFSRKFARATVVPFLRFTHNPTPGANEAQSWFFQFDGQISCSASSNGGATAMTYYRATFPYARWGNTTFSSSGTSPRDTITSALSSNTSALNITTTLWNTVANASSTLVQIQQSLSGTEANNPSISDIFLTGTIRLYYMCTTLNVSPILSIEVPA